ncbi:MAG: HAD family phosphatase [Planctomycetes bacterium]|nr:HAD family phosphatase [Planctomycetota bacterium]
MPGAPDDFRAEGVVFDLDGTLVDNMALHAEAFALFVRAHGLPELDEAMRHRLDGRRNRDIFPILFGRELDDESLRSYSREKEEHYRRISHGRLRPLPGLIAFLDQLDRAGVPVAIATSAPAPNVRHSLEELGLTARFPRIRRSDEVARGKPHPDVFLAAAEALGVAPARCLAFEDAPAGIAAAASAGMSCVGITTSFSDSMLAETWPLRAAIADYNLCVEDPARFGLA